MKGSYLLVFHVQQPLNQLRVGRLGCFDIASGYYLYVGSAFGSGGIAARLRHHLRRDKPRLHWHIDYLRAYAVLQQAWTIASDVRLECRWCRRLAVHPELTMPIPGFGSRDTGCASHLFYRPTPPSVQLLLELLLADLPTDHDSESRIEIHSFPPEIS